LYTNVYQRVRISYVFAFFIIVSSGIFMVVAGKHPAHSEVIFFVPRERVKGCQGTLNVAKKDMSKC